MAVTSRSIANVPVASGANDSAAPIRWWRPIAVIMWCVAVGLTAQNFPDAWQALGWGVAAITQAVCTKLEAPLWNKTKREQVDDHDHLIMCERPRWWLFGPYVEVPDLRPVPWSAYAALVVGTATNLRGAWELVQAIHTWEPVVVVLDIFNAPPLAPVEGWSALLACCMIGIVVEALPELLWSAD